MFIRQIIRNLANFEAGQFDFDAVAFSELKEVFLLRPFWTQKWLLYAVVSLEPLMGYTMVGHLLNFIAVRTITWIWK